MTPERTIEAYQLDQLLWLDAQSGGKRERLRKAFVDHGDLQIHRQLSGLTQSRLAHVDGFFSHCGKKRFEFGESLFFSADDEDELRTLCADFRSGDGSVKVVGASLAQLRRKIA